VDVIFDLLGDLLGELIGRPISNRRGRSLARQIAKLTQARRTGQPVSATLPAALHAGEAVPPRPHAWQPGRLKITPPAVSWQRRGLLRSRSRDLTSAQYIQQRQPNWSGIDRRLSAPGYLAPSVRVLGPARQRRANRDHLALRGHRRRPARPRPPPGHTSEPWLFAGLDSRRTEREHDPTGGLLLRRVFRAAS